MKLPHSPIANLVNFFVLLTVRFDITFFVQSSVKQRPILAMVIDCEMQHLRELSE